MSGKLNNLDFEIHLNEYRTIKEFRERCVKNIEESTRTYIQFIGFVIASIAILITNKLLAIVFIILAITFIVVR